MSKIDKHGFTIKPTITDTECILICLKNAPAGTDRKQVERLITEYQRHTQIMPNRLRDGS